MTPYHFFKIINLLHGACRQTMIATLWLHTLKHKLYKKKRKENEKKREKKREENEKMKRLDLEKLNTLPTT